MSFGIGVACMVIGLLVGAAMGTAAAAAKIADLRIALIQEQEKNNAEDWKVI